jgi:hypothetical protein
MKYLRTEGTRWAVTLALFGLFMQIFIPLAQAISIGDDEDGFPTRMVICTLYGTKVIDIITGEEVSSETDNGSEACPVCSAFLIGATSIAGVPELSLPTPAYTSSFIAAPLEAILVAKSGSSRYTARAPPLKI